VEVRLGMGSPSRIVVTNNGEVAIVRFIERKITDDTTIQGLGEELLGLVEHDGRRLLLLNFEGVEFLSSAMLNKLISVNSKAKALGGSVKICNLRTELRDVFKITRLDRMFDIRTTEVAALAAF
jgi:anti-sigma B factor antagonist